MIIILILLIGIIISYGRWNAQLYSDYEGGWNDEDAPAGMIIFFILLGWIGFIIGLMFWTPKNKFFKFINV